MEQVFISKEELIKKINEQLTSQLNPLFTVASLQQAAGELPNWWICGISVFLVKANGGAVIEPGSIAEIHNQFSTYQVNWLQ